jgi:hypothetical protein
MHSTTSEPDPTPLVEDGDNSLLYGLGAAMLSVVLILCVLITEATLAWLLISLAAMVVAIGCVGVFILRFIDADH